MSISNVVVKQKYTGDTVTVAFPIPFAFIPGELSVIKVAMYDSVTKDPITPVPSYTLTPAGDTPTEVTFALAPAATETIMVYRELPLTQVVDYIQNGSFLAESHEQGLDRIVLMIQQLADKGARSLEINMLDEGTIELALPPLIAGRVLGVTALGDAFEWIDRAEFKGDKGDQGDAATITIGTVTPLSPSSSPSVVNAGTSTDAILNFGLPTGATVAVGTVTEIDFVDVAPMEVTNSGTPLAAILDFVLRKGPKGDTGDAATAIYVEAYTPTTEGQDGEIWIDSTNGDLYRKAAGTWGLEANITGPPGGVDSFNTRAGAVVPVAGDYLAADIPYTNATSGLVATTVQAAIDEIDNTIDTLDLLPAQAGNAGKFLQTDGSAASWQTVVTSPTLQDVYGNSTDGEIALNSTKGPIVLKDNATPIGTLFELENNAGSTSFFKVDAAGTHTTNFTGTGTAGAVRLHYLTTAQRNALTPAEGMLIANSSTNQVNAYINGVWAEVDREYIASDTGLSNGGTIGISLTHRFQTFRVSGSSTPVTLSGTPFGSSAPLDGAQVTLIGVDDSLAVTFATNDTAKGLVGYSFTLGRYQTATLKYNQALDRWVIISTSN